MFITRRSKRIGVDGPHISAYAAVIASLTRVGERESGDDRLRTRRLDRRIRKVIRWVQSQGFSVSELEEFAAAAVIAFIEENIDRKREVESSYADYIRAYEMDRAGKWLAGELRVRKESLRAGGFARHEPTRHMKHSIKKEWEAWQANRSMYRWPRDFRSAMMKKYPEAVDGTLKNWMSAWGKESKSN